MLTLADVSQMKLEMLHRGVAPCEIHYGDDNYFRFFRMEMTPKTFDDLQKDTNWKNVYKHIPCRDKGMLADEKLKGAAGYWDSVVFFIKEGASNGIV